jgi:glycosyltransferase involved in cell wall biosynthesis
MKEASALAHAGYEVHVLGAWLEPAFKVRDLCLMETIPFTFSPVFDVTLPGQRKGVRGLIMRARKRAAHLAFRVAGRQSPLQLGIAIERLSEEAEKLAADLYIAHSEPSLVTARRLMRAGRRVGVDMEDWFSEDLLPEARRARPLELLRSLERDLLSQGAYASCPSRAMSAALGEEHGCMPPTVIYNAFAWSERKTIDSALQDRRTRKIPSIHWYSTTLGPSRGLEDLVAAIPLLKHEFEIHLRGNPAPGFEPWIKGQIPEAWRNRIVFHPLVTNDQLLSRVAEHDVGFAGEMKYCRSRDLTVTNKIMHYLLAGLAVVASDTAGQREVAEAAPLAVMLYRSGDACSLAELLNGLLGSPERMRRAREAALAAARTTFCWERQEGALLAAVALALDQPATRH